MEQPKEIQHVLEVIKKKGPFLKKKEAAIGRNMEELSSLTMTNMFVLLFPLLPL